MYTWRRWNKMGSHVEPLQANLDCLFFNDNHERHTNNADISSSENELLLFFKTSCTTLSKSEKDDPNIVVSVCPMHNWRKYAGDMHSSKLTKQVG
jgi:hypothetical protein